MSRGTKLAYTYTKNGKIEYVYARNEAEARRIAPKDVTLTRAFYGRNDSKLGLRADAKATSMAMDGNS